MTEEEGIILDEAYSILVDYGMLDCTIPTFDHLPIERVVYSGNTTTVFFEDGTKAVVKCSDNDRYDRQNAVVYALVKRLFGKLGHYDAKAKKLVTNEADGNGIGTKLEKIVKAGFDQDAELAAARARKAKAKEEHIARQKAESEAAWKRKVERRAKELKLEMEAKALLEKQAGKSKILDESLDNGSLDKPCYCKKQKKLDDCFKEDETYVRPKKKFSDFTPEEKRAYWRAQKQGML